MSKLFKDCDWEDDLPSVETNFRFSKSIKGNKHKKSKRKLDPQGTETDGNRQDNVMKPAGWSVLLAKETKPKSVGKSENGCTQTEQSNVKSKVKKRKAHDEEDNNGIVDRNNKPAKKKGKPNELVTKNGVSAKKPKAEHVAANVDQQTLQNQPARAASEEQHPLSTTNGNDPRSENLRDKLVDRLKGSRFRFINEQLYKTTGAQAKKLFQEDPTSFEAYHEGYRRQVEQWPMNPLNRMIRSILKLPKNTIVADFGCGDARLAASIPNQVYSLDLVSNNNSVIACDMANTPLESNFVNVVVFCLSLMGVNLTDFLLEANRVLKIGGLLKIAEVSSRFKSVNEFISNIQKCGFKLKDKDMKNSLFYFFNFTKERTILKGSTKMKQFSLNPCLYKKR